MLPGASRASAAGSERGRARKPMPNALTIAATPSPVVSATAPTASGAVNAIIVSLLGCGVDQRLDQQPLADEPGAQRKPGRAERGHTEQCCGGRHPARQPTQPVEVAQSGGGQHRPCGQEPQALERRMPNQVQHRGGHRDRRRPRRAGIREQRRRAQSEE